MISHRPHLARAAGFSFVELLTVVAVIAALLGVVMVAAPAMSTMLRGSQLTQGAQIILDQLALARQTALAKNRAIEVRFYKYADPEAGGKEAFRAIQVFEISPTGSVTPASKFLRLPASVIMDQSAALSTLINTDVFDGSEPIPNYGTDYEYTVLRFFPDGSTNLTPVASKWFVTLHSQIEGDNLTDPPKNFATLQVDPINGTVKVFRP